VVLDSESPFVEAAKFEGTEVYVSEGVVDFLEADVLASQGLSDVDPLAVPPDGSVATDEADLVVGRIVDSRNAARHFARGRAVPGGRRVLVEGFVRTLLVVLVLKLVEASLLAGQVAAGRTGGLGFESSVHAFVSSILLGMSRFDQLG
jgi:hypothetical protein